MTSRTRIISSRNLLLPKRVPAERPWAKICIKVYRAEGLPSMSAGIMGGFSKIVGEKKVFIDPYVQVLFAGQQVSLCLGTGLSVSHRKASADPLFFVC